MRPSLTSTEYETQPDIPKAGESDLDHFAPATTSKRIDDKAATLEAELTGLKQSFARERFIYIFITSLLFIMALGQSLTGALLGILVAFVLVFLIAMGKYLDFPWIVLPLERWHDMLFNATERRLNGPQITVEPRNGDAE